MIDKYKQRELQAESSIFSQSKAKLYQDKDHKFDNVSLNDKRDAKGKLVQAGENRKAELVQADKMNEQSTDSAMIDEVADKASEHNKDLVQAGEVSINCSAQEADMCSFVSANEQNEIKLELADMKVQLRQMNETLKQVLFATVRNV